MTLVTEVNFGDFTTFCVLMIFQDKKKKKKDFKLRHVNTNYFTKRQQHKSVMTTIILLFCLDSHMFSITDGLVSAVLCSES